MRDEEIESNYIMSKGNGMKTTTEEELMASLIQDPPNPYK